MGLVAGDRAYPYQFGGTFLLPLLVKYSRFYINPEGNEIVAVFTKTVS